LQVKGLARRRIDFEDHSASVPLVVYSEQATCQ
jgi:hypothetical protein